MVLDKEESVPMLSVQPKGKQKGCAGCNRKIKDRYLLKALDKYWHEDCLKCACCDCRLGEVGSTLYTKANLILCRRDYLRLFGTTGNCAACSKLIPAFEMVMRARDNVYHLDCFACQLCNQRFCVGDKFFLKNNMILCQMDYEEGQLNGSFETQREGFMVLLRERRRTLNKCPALQRFCELAGTLALLSLIKLLKDSDYFKPFSLAYGFSQRLIREQIETKSLMDTHLARKCLGSIEGILSPGPVDAPDQKVSSIITVPLTSLPSLPQHPHCCGGAQLSHLPQTLLSTLLLLPLTRRDTGFVSRERQVEVEKDESAKWKKGDIG
ncbi:hypothetical protein J4Q44_G00352290 [Coregonus suidteri]|uniref:LIM zinc-binding domain-containing protein n=2 Tax=Salmonidae TaxID=8015 RepID=A0AAN8KGN0_9TELE